MRLLQLHLERFGPFTGQTLTFEPTARLHVVHGPNEAGKSSALAALTDLLFGIDRKTPYDFRHDRKDLRVGASIQNTKGETLAFRRRPGNKNTLLRPDSDSTLPEDILAGFIGAIDRPVFCNAFGLNAQTLRSGAEDMLKSEGDVGASLFAAASGLRGLAGLRQQLETEAAAIFAARASQGRTFYQALARFEQARKVIRERELRDGPWKELNGKIETLSGDLKTLGEARRTHAEERARLSRLKRVAPQIRLIDEEIAKLDALGPLPDAPLGTAEKLSQALERRNAAAEHLRRTGEDEQRALANHAGITVDEAILARSEDVVTLFSELGAYAAARKDLPGVEREVAAFVRNLDGLAARLGFPDCASLEDAQPTDLALALVRELISEGPQRGVALAGSQAELAAEVDVLADLEQQATGLDQVVDSKPLQQQFAAIAPVLRQLERREEVAEEVSNLSRQVGYLASRLTPPVDPQSLAAAPLPTAETIARYRQLLDETNNTLLRIKDRLGESVGTSSALQRRIKDFETGTPIASAQEIAHRREERDTLWSRLRHTLFGGTDTLAGPSLMEAVSDFDRLLAETDQMADAALLDSARSEAYTAARKQFLDEQTRAEGLRSSIQDLEDKLAQDGSAYVELWQSAGIVPLPPAEMASWLESVARLRTLSEELEAARTTLETMDGAAEGIVPTLVELAIRLGLEDLKRLPPRLAAPAVEARLREMTDAWQERRAFDGSLGTARNRIERLERRRDEAAQQQADWQIRWQPAIAAVGLSDATIDQAHAALEVWQMVPGACGERDNRSRRVASMKRDIDSFARRGATLIAELAPDLATLPPDDALRRLNESLAEAIQGNSARAEAQKRVTQAAKASADARAEFAAANDALEMLTSLLPKDSDLAALCERLKRRDQLVDSVAKMKTQLLSQGEGQDEAALRRELEGFEPDGAAARLKVLEAEDEQCESQSKDAFSERKRALDEKDALEKGVGAEVAWVTRRSAEAELAAAAHEYSVLKLGALLLGAAIDRHRSDQQDPLMTRAGTLFAGLTGGSYSALGQAFDDEDMPRLIGTRRTGEQVHIAGMSDGARDQLYLALRLAYLEDYASRSEPIPFIGDDIFMTFDDARTKNGILALAAIGGAVQPILFTHHQYVVDLAHETLGHGVNILKLGIST